MNVTTRASFSWVWLWLAIATLGIGAMLFFQRQAAMELRSELDAAQAQREDLARLRRENDRLRAGQISAAQLDALRADHAAVVRLRRELDALQKK